MHGPVYAVREKDDEVLRFDYGYDDSLIGPQPVTLELKNLDKPQPGTISILEDIP
jgi:hypothetical protein